MAERPVTVVGTVQEAGRLVDMEVFDGSHQVAADYLKVIHLAPWVRFDVLKPFIERDFVLTNGGKALMFRWKNYMVEEGPKGPFVPEKEVKCYGE